MILHSSVYSVYSVVPIRIPFAGRPAPHGPDDARDPQPDRQQACPARFGNQREIRAREDGMVRRRLASIVPVRGEDQAEVGAALLEINAGTHGVAREVDLHHTDADTA